MSTETKTAALRHRVILGRQEKEYKDDITHLDLIKVINAFNQAIAGTDIEKNLVNAIFQKAFDEDEFGVVCSLETIPDNIDDIIRDLKEKFGHLEIIGYCIADKSAPKKFTNVQYYVFSVFTSKNPIQNRDFGWKYSMTSFSQVTKECSDQVHEFVVKQLDSAKRFNFIGIGGESYFYGLSGVFDHITCITNCENVHENNEYNQGYHDDAKTHVLEHVDYAEVNMHNYVDKHKQNVLVVNISRKGLGALADQIVVFSPYIQKIIYIGCEEKAIKRDLDKLKDAYDIKASLESGAMVYVMELKPMD